ncbi:MAG: Crp/Fnr family transcriptional regulator [Lachnospiraceae bacterium]|nr:Crp/Fnr family transcriptional regulator [Lachnospiraceae bacterium]
MINHEDIELLVSNLPFWEQLNPSQKELLISGSKSTHFSKGQAVHYGENECIGVILVKHGTLRTYITSDEGREITLYRLEDGDICILSASCILQTIDFDVSIDAESECDMIQISSLTFSRLSSENVYVELFSHKLATERFSDVMWAMQQILFTSFDKRLAAFLLDESTKSESDDIHMTHEQIAKYLGTAREVVSRMLKYFSEEGYVTLKRGGISITDKKLLRSLL